MYLHDVGWDFHDLLAVSCLKLCSNIDFIVLFVCNILNVCVGASIILFTITLTLS